MAAIKGNYDFWNMTSEELLLKGWHSVENAKTISATYAILSIVMSPVIVFGNSLVILSVCKDPLKKLCSSPSNRIIISMAIADLLVGLVVCPLTAYWGWSAFQNTTLETLTSALFSVLTNVSAGHVFLLSIDRFFALVTPLQYRVKVTNKRVCLATVTCWVYFVLYGCAFGLWQKEYYFILGTIYNLQILCILICILVINTVTLYRFRKYSKTTEAQDQSTANRQMMLQREKHVSKAIAIVISAFLFCLIPRIVLQKVIYFCFSCNHHLSLLMLLYAITAVLGCSNSGINPFLYAWRLPKYRDTFKYYLKNGKKCCSSQNIDDENSVWDTRL